MALTINRSRSKETNLTSTYQRGNLSFLYPENWLLSESDSSDDASLQVTLESPGGGLWILSATSASTDTAAAMAEALKAVHEQFEDTGDDSEHEQTAQNLTAAYPKRVTRPEVHTPANE